MASLIDPSGKKVVDELSILCRATGLHVSDNMAPLDMNRTLQGEWYRGSERFKIAGEPPKDLTLKILRALGLINEVRAPTDRDHYYHGALLLGATVIAVRKRLAFLLEECDRGMSVARQLFLLGSGRKLDPTKESTEVLLKPAPELPFKPGWSMSPGQPLPETEIAMMKLVIDQSLTDEWSYEAIPAPSSADTEATFECWKLTTSNWRQETGRGDGNRFLIISSQPYVGHQLAVAKRVLGSSVKITAIGPAASVKTLPLATYLDTIAKQLYEEVGRPPKN
jgi:hypothetical protein